MLLNFIMIVLAVALGIVIGMGSLFVLIMNQKVLDWYMEKTNKMVAKSLDKMNF